MEHCENVLNCHFWFVCYLSETFICSSFLCMLNKHSKVIPKTILNNILILKLLNSVYKSAYRSLLNPPNNELRKNHKM